MPRIETGNTRGIRVLYRVFSGQARTCLGLGSSYRWTAFVSAHGHKAAAQATDAARPVLAGILDHHVRNLPV